MKFLELCIDVNGIQKKHTLTFHTLMISKNSEILIIDTTRKSANNNYVNNFDFCH
jgi:hypothetical protein